ncbi:hypothetical protein DV736_g1724, partial [Chaetothyriales sp. CBS 134916]
MDLLATVRKEGSRGGTGDFKWSDVQSSSHREQYLGHSLHAPVGRYNQGKDLSWYTRDKAKDSHDTQDPAAAAARERAEEIKRIKEAEEDALARALGLPVAPRANANTRPLGDRREVDKILKESAEEHTGSSGIGFSHSSHQPQGHSEEIERLDGNTDQQDKELKTEGTVAAEAVREIDTPEATAAMTRYTYTDDALLQERGRGTDDDRPAPTTETLISDAERAADITVADLQCGVVIGVNIMIDIEANTSCQRSSILRHGNYRLLSRALWGLDTARL